MTADLQTALGLANQGFRVFPLKPNSKKPAIQKWPEKATTDAETIKKWWADSVRGRSAAWGVGVATGRGLVVIDIDVKHNGEASFNLLEFGNGKLKPSLQVKTPSGGRHLYFRASEPFGNSASAIAPGVDTRGEGGYVVGPGTVINGAAYKTNRGDLGAGVGALSDLPACWAALLLRKTATARDKGSSDSATPVSDMDTPAAIERAKDYLRELDPAVEGERNGHGYRTACRIKDFGVSQTVCENLMLEHWRCEPMIDHGELEHVVNSAYTYGTEAPGAANPQADFEPLPGTPETPERRGLSYVLAKDIKARTKQNSLIKGYLDRGAMSVMYGESNTGKTFLAMDMAFHVATGRPWFGYKIPESGAAVYVAAEGGGGAKNRVEALKKQHNLDDFPLALVPCAVDLRQKNADTQALIKLIGDVEADTGLPVLLVVIDTLSRALAGGNENSSEDMGALVCNLDRLRDETGAHVMIVHHSGKDRAKGARGHSSLRAATDTEIEIGGKWIKVTKQRDMEQSKNQPFALQPVALGEDDDGDSITSCVVVRGGGSPSDDFARAPLTSQKQAALDVLKETIMDVGVEPKELGDERVFGRAVQIDQWRERCRGTISTGGRRAQNKAFTAARNQLEELGLVEIYEQFVWFNE